MDSDGGVDGEIERDERDRKERSNEGQNIKLDRDQKGKYGK